MINGHGGNVVSLARKLNCPVDDIIDMSCNLNPLGPPLNLENFLKENMFKIRSLPQADAGQMVEAFSRYYGIDTGQVLAGNGTTWFLYTLPLALKTRHMLIAGPAYSDYADGCRMHDVPFSYCMADSDTGFNHDPDAISNLLSDRRYGFDTMVICNPNNPTGTLMQRQDLLNLVDRHMDVTFIIDESYLPFVDDAEEISLVPETRFPNLIVLSSMSKIFRIPGLRTGFVSTHPTVIDRLMKYYQPWSVNSLAQAAIVYIFEQSHLIEPFIRETRQFIRTEKELFYDLLDAVEGIDLFPSHTYFVLARLSGAMTSGRFCESIGRGKILIRDCSNFNGLSNRYVRFSLNTRQYNTDLVRRVAHVTEDLIHA
jgi:threonine-phosphate decarboxylase